MFEANAIATPTISFDSLQQLVLILLHLQLFKFRGDKFQDFFSLWKYCRGYSLRNSI